MRDHGFERNELSLADRDEPVEPSGTFTRAKRSSSVPGSSAITPSESERPGDVRERLAGPDGERRQDRVDLALEVRPSFSSSLSEHSSTVGDLDPRGGERRPKLALPELRLPRGELVDALPDRRERPPGASPSAERTGDLRLLELEQAGDADHEELVEELGEDRGELHSLEERQRLVLRELEHARVELDRGARG